MATVKVVKALMTSIQDLGREGFRSLGVPVSGAMDRLSAAYANALVGNPVDEAVLEVIGGGLEVVVEGEAVVSVTGADTKVLVNDELASTWKPIAMLNGGRLRIEVPRRGLINYVAFSGGLIIKRVLGSKSTYVRAGFGGVEGRFLRPGDTLITGSVDASTVWDVVKNLTVPDDVKYRLPPQKGELVLRVTKGIHYDKSPKGFEELINGSYRVSPESDRMGFRLEGDVIEAARSLGRLPSTAMDRGFVQVPPNGKPIVLMADSQTTGGYAVLAHVIQADVDSLAQSRPGQKVRFKEVSLEEAEKLMIKYLSRLEQLLLKVVITEEEYWGEALPVGIAEALRSARQ